MKGIIGYDKDGIAIPSDELLREMMKPVFVFVLILAMCAWGFGVGYGYWIGNRNACPDPRAHEIQDERKERCQNYYKSTSVSAMNAPTSRKSAHTVLTLGAIKLNHLWAKEPRLKSPTGARCPTPKTTTSRARAQAITPERITLPPSLPRAKSARSAIEFTTATFPLWDRDTIPKAAPFNASAGRKEK